MCAPGPTPARTSSVASLSMVTAPIDHVSVVEVHQLHRGVAAERHAIAEREQVPRALAQIHAFVHVHLVADASAEHPQHHRQRVRAGQRGPRNVCRQTLHDPDPHVDAAPRRMTAGRARPQQQARGDRR